MAGFFSLGSASGSGSGRDPQDPPPPANNTDSTNINTNNPNWGPNPTQPGLLLYRNEEIYQKGFEIWQQYVQVHHQYPKAPPHHHPPPFLHHHHHLYLGSGGGGGDHYFPSSSAGPSSGSGAGSRVMMRPGGGGGSGNGMNCQDCGNQAKKDCEHMRCRTCCKSRGFDCSTHVKSTWVPAAKRRERHQQQLLALNQQQQQQQQPQPQQPPQQLEVGTREKRLRESRDPPQLGASSSGLVLGQHFPAELSSLAVFRCVRVHSVDDADEQLAYQTAINIGGHLFKGILYDQGPESHPASAGDCSGGEASGVGTIQHHNLLTAAANNDTALVDPNAIYPPPPISAFLAGTQFFPPPRS